MSENSNNDKNATLPEGFDQPTGPFAKNDLEQSSFADEADNGSENTANVEELFDQPDETEKLLGELADMKDQVLRAMAESENTRRRAVKDREDAKKYAISGFAKDLLSVSDNLRRGLEAVPEDVSGSSDHFKNLLAGVEATERELLKAFDTHGIKKLDPLDQPFDPNFHEVMFETPIPDKPAGLVIQVLEPGYVLNDRLLRPARVGVSKDAPAEDGSEPPQRIDTEA